MENPKTVSLKPNHTAFLWTNKEKPELNHWYRVIGDVDRDYWKIAKDFHSHETGITYYKIVEYFNGDILYSGKTLASIRQIMRNNTYRMVLLGKDSDDE